MGHPMPIVAGLMSRPTTINLNAIRPRTSQLIRGAAAWPMQVVLSCG
jgi:hypothetical protein